MLSLTYSLTTYTDFLQQLAALLHVPVEQNKIQIPEEFGTGYFKVVTVNNDVEALVYNVKFKQDLVMRRNRDSREFYTLVFDDLEVKNSFSLRIGSDKLEGEADRNTALYLTSFLFDVEYMLNRNTEIRGVRILLTEPWMQQYLQLSQNESVLEKYINLKTAGVWYKPVDASLKGTLNDLVTDQNTPLLFYQNKVMRIVESFFQWLYDEMKDLHATGISRADIEAAQKVESIITNDITALPPTIKELAKEVAMSESKLKKIFKTVYGLPPYEYFQKQRMQKARIMLLSGNYSIKDIGYTLGYVNLSNFTLAFKKEFGKLPSEVAKENAIQAP